MTVQNTSANWTLGGNGPVYVCCALRCPCLSTMTTAGPVLQWIRAFHVFWPWKNTRANWTLSWNEPVRACPALHCPCLSSMSTAGPMLQWIWAFHVFLRTTVLEFRLSTKVIQLEILRFNSTPLCLLMQVHLVAYRDLSAPKYVVYEIDELTLIVHVDFHL